MNLMNAIEDKPNDLTDPKWVGDRRPVTVTPVPSAETLSPSGAIQTEPKNNGVQASISSRAKRVRIAVIVIGFAIIVSLALGLVPRWRQRNLALSDTAQLALPSVSVVSPTPGKPGNGLVLPAEILPWREASIFARANGYLKDWVAD